MTGLMSSGAACPAPPAADGNQPVRGWTTAAFRSDLNGAELVVSIPSKKKIEFLENTSKKILALKSREKTMTASVRWTRNTIEFIVRRCYLVWFVSILCPPIGLTGVTHKQQLY